jgi:transposase
MQRHALSDKHWEIIEPFVTKKKKTNAGRPPIERRQIVDGILWIVRTGAPWRDLPDRFGPWKTVYHWFNEWSKDGTWDRILEALQIRLDEAGRIDWDLWCVDGSNVRASRAASGGGEKGGLANPKTTRWAARAADSEANSTWLLTVEDYR